MESPWSQAWWLRSLTSRSVKEFLPRLSVVAWEPTKVATVVQNLVVTAMRTTTPAIAAEEIAMTDEMMIARIDIPTSVVLPRCLQFRPLACQVAFPSQCQLLPTACRCFLLDLPSQDKLLHKQHHNPLHQDIAVEELFAKKYEQYTASSTTTRLDCNFPYTLTHECTFTCKFPGSFPSPTSALRPAFGCSRYLTRASQKGSPGLGLQHKGPLS